MSYKPPAEKLSEIYEEALLLGNEEAQSLAAALKVCVEGLLELQNHEVCVCGSAAMRATLSEAARLASEGE